MKEEVKLSSSKSQVDTALDLADKNRNKNVKILNS